MKRNFQNAKHVFATLFFALCAIATFAVPADPNPVTVDLPDGSTLTIRKHGDEAYHYTTTEDGYLIDMASDGFYYFMEKDSQNKLKTSNVKVRDLKKRTASDKRKLAKFDKTLRPSKDKIVRKTISKPSYKLNKNHTKASNAAATPTRQNVLVILAQFPDVQFKSGNATTIANQLNQENYNTDGATGSVRDFYYESSRHQVELNFVVKGPYTVSENMAYYGGNDANGNDLRPREFVVEACQLADNDGVDFSQFDSDNNGRVDNVYVIFAGKGEAAGGTANTIWPHSWVIADKYGYLTTKIDGKWLENYACSAELNSSNRVDGIGTFCHEFGHVFGLPDFYDVDSYETNGKADGLGQWSLMASGNYNNNSKTPPQLSCLERRILGWELPANLNSARNVTLPPLDGNVDNETAQSYKIETTTTGEYFLIENRKKEGWDAYLPGAGMLVYHIDENLSDPSSWSDNKINIDPNHQGAYLVKAYGSTTDSGNTPFPGGKNVTSLTNLETWNGTAVDKPITEISLNSGVINFKFMGGEATLNCSRSESETMVFDAHLNQRSDIQEFTISGSGLHDNVDVMFADASEGSGFKVRKKGNTKWETYFELTPTNGQLATTTIQVCFEPTTIGDTNAEYSHTATIGIDTPGADIYLNMVGIVTAGDVQLTRALTNDELDFGICAVNQAAPRTIAISATDLATNIQLQMVNNTGNAFSLSSSTITRAAASTELGKEIIITFTPTQVGIYNTTLNLVSGGTTLKSITLKGRCE